MCRSLSMCGPLQILPQNCIRHNLSIKKYFRRSGTHWHYIPELDHSAPKRASWIPPEEDERRDQPKPCSATTKAAVPLNAPPAGRVHPCWADQYVAVGQVAAETTTGSAWPPTGALSDTSAPGFGGVVLSSGVAHGSQIPQRQVTQHMVGPHGLLCGLDSRCHIVTDPSTGRQFLAVPANATPYGTDYTVGSMYMPPISHVPPNGPSYRFDPRASQWPLPPNVPTQFDGRTSHRTSSMSQSSPSYPSRQACDPDPMQASMANARMWPDESTAQMQPSMPARTEEWPTQPKRHQPFQPPESISRAKIRRVSPHCKGVLPQTSQIALSTHTQKHITMADNGSTRPH